MSAYFSSSTAISLHACKLACAENVMLTARGPGHDRR